MKSGTPRPVLTVVQVGLVGALIGLIIGLYDAARLYSIPFGPLLEPDVGYMVWFVAPLVNGTVGLVGGLLAGWLKGNRHPIAKVVASALGAAGALLACKLAVTVLRSRARDFRLPVSWFWLTLVLGSALLAYYLIRRREQRSFRARGFPPLRMLAVTLLASVVVLLSGLAFSTVKGSLPPASVTAGSRSAVGSPNVVLITLDTVRPDHLSLYGYSRPTSPNLDRWARQGVVFDNAVSASSWTLASHASIFTGLLPHQHGADWARPLDTSRWTLAEVLRSRGYATAGFTSNLEYGEAGWGLGQGFERYEDAKNSVLHNLAATLAGGLLIQPLYGSLVRHDFLERREASVMNHDVIQWFKHRSGEPFFLFVNYFDAHSPYFAPPPFDRRFGQTSKVVLDKAWPIMDEADFSHPLSDQERQSLVDAYDNCLASLDDQVGKLLTFLASQPEWSNTVVIITSDHGEAFGEHRAYNHGWNLYRETVHVPLIIFGPGVPAGMRLANTVSVRKLFPTVLDLTLGEKPPFSRLSLRRFWTPGFRPQPLDEVAISELVSRKAGVPGYISLTTPGWQYIEDSRGRKELYQWASSPEERVNLAESNPQKAHELESSLRQYIASSLRPWVEPRYLFALGPARGLLQDPGAGRKGMPSAAPPIGTSQAYFPPQPSERVQQRVEDKELIESLPYQ
jgi:arylsulfatase A-like enzyme